MPVEIRVPTLGESVVEATVSRWLKSPGEPIAAGEVVVELETDKVNVEVPAESSGVLGEIARGEGETVGVGEVLGLVSENGTAAQPAPPQDAAPASPAPRTEDGASRNGGDSPASPVARRVAEENDVDLRQVRGSGPGGKITKGDVADHIERREEAPATAKAKARETVEAAPAPVITTAAAPAPTAPRPAAAAPPPRPTPTPGQASSSPGRPEERVRMSRRRQTIATRLVEAQQTAAMLTTFNEIDMSTVMEVRKRRKDSFKERHGVNLGFMSFFTKAAIGALRAFPYLNAEIQGDEIVVKKYYDIGIAVSAEEGLVVPVVRDADKKSFAQIEKDILDLATRARENKLSLPDLTGGTFTITNGGIFGSLMSTPILNAPQVGILGMHTIKERPIGVGGEIVLRPMMYVALSYDHRIVDGSEAVRFLVRIKELIEDSETLLLEG